MLLNVVGRPGWGWVGATFVVAADRKPVKMVIYVCIIILLCTHITFSDYQQNFLVFNQYVGVGLCANASQYVAELV